MDAFLPMLKNVILFVLLAVPGFVLIKTKILHQEHTGVLSKLLVYVGSPFFVLYNMMRVDFSGDTVKGLFLSFVIYVIALLVFYFLSMIFSIVKCKDPIEKRKKSNMMRFCEIFANNGFMGLPLALAVFPNNPTLIAFLIVANILNNVFMYTIGINLANDGKSKINYKKILLNPVLISFVISIPLNLLKVKDYLPEIETYSGWLNNLVTPLAMTVLGMKMGGIKFSTIFSSKQNYIVSTAKLIVFPVIGIAIAFLIAPLLPGEKFNLIMSSFICWATPTAALATTFADQYGGDSEGAAIYTLGTTLLSVITIPLLYMLLVLII
jgi:predicted permease